MAEKPAKKPIRRPERASMAPKQAISKLEKSVAHWLRKNLPTKKTKFLHSHEVSFFSGIKAVDALMNDSPWSASKVEDPETAELVFDSREKCTDFLDELLKHKMFHRAKKIPVVEPLKPGKKKKKVDEKTDGDDTDVGKKQDDDDKKKKRKIRLDMHLDQVFLDSSDAYVWLYDPIPWYYWGVGTVIVLTVIGVCLFPLWPVKMRIGVHYLSIAAAVFLLGVLGLAVLKYLIFGLLFALSGGKLKFWIFPNLTEDVGFFQSFYPIYDYTYIETVKKEKLSDDEDDSDEDQEKQKNGGSESEDSTSKKSSTGKDFELIDGTDADEDLGSN